MSRRRWIIAIVIVAVLVLGGPLLAIATDNSKPEQQTPPLDLASTASSKFLNGYVSPDGQVKVSQNETPGQAQVWALLIAAASGDSSHFKNIFNWTQANIPSGQQDTEITTDMAWALAVAGPRLGVASYTGQANALALNIDNSPPDHLADGVDNGIFFLGIAQLENGLARVPLRSMVDNQRQAIEGEMGGPKYSRLPVGSSANNYSGDAMNQTINLSSSCDVSDKSRAVYIWTKLRVSRNTRTATALSSNGKVLNSTQDVRAAVASAAAAKAAGEMLQTYNLLNDADGIQQRHPSAQGAEWDALGRILVTTPWLGSCG